MNEKHSQDFLEFLRGKKESLNSLGVLQFDQSRYSIFDGNHCNVSGSVSVCFNIKNNYYFVDIDATVTTIIERDQLTITGIDVNENADYHLSLALANFHDSDGDENLADAKLSFSDIGLSDDEIKEVEDILNSYWSVEKMKNWQDSLKLGISVKMIIAEFKG